MERAEPTSPPAEGLPLDPSLFARNLAALRQVEPALASDVENARPPVGVQLKPARTRDGKAGFLLVQPDGAEAWFGRSSIPGVRAESLLEQFQDGAANVLLAGIGEGTEAALLTQRLGVHRAVFVWEQDALAVQLALRLHDVADAIRAQRLILLVCPETQLPAGLNEWLARHAGHLCPERIMIWPWHSLADASAIRSAVEAAFNATHNARQQALGEMAGRPRPAPPTEPRRLAILAMRAAEEVWSVADALGKGAETLGWQAAISTVRGPGDMHPLGRLMHLIRQRAWPPHGAVLLDITRQEVRDVLPPDVAAVCWLSGHANIENLPARAGRDAVAFANSWLMQRAISLGLDSRQASVCPPACIESAAEGGERAERDVDVALCADLCPADAASYGHTMPSHIQIWDAMLELATADTEVLTAEDFSKLLVKAERKAGARIEDAGLRQQLIDTFLLRIAPTVMYRALAHALEAAGYKVEAYGQGWGRLRTPAGSLQDLAARCRVLVHADLAGVATSAALSFAGSGAVVLARRYPHFNRPGGLGTLLRDGKEMLTFTSFRDLAGQLAHLQTDARLSRVAEAALARCGAEHTPAARLQQLWAALSSCQFAS